MVVVESCEGSGEFCLPSSQYLDMDLDFWVKVGLEYGDALFNALSASRTRRSRACWRVESDSFTRATACLSGWMLKFSTVWRMSWIC